MMNAYEIDDQFAEVAKALQTAHGSHSSELWSKYLTLAIERMKERAVSPGASSHERDGYAFAIAELRTLLDQATP